MGDCRSARRRWLATGLAAVLFAIGGLPLHAQPVSVSVPDAKAPAAATFDAMFDQTMARYRLPGLAVGVIENGEVVYLRTAGELAAGGGQSVTADTLFKIASNSKAMTTAVLARLVDAGTLHWDDPVTRYLPAFRMYDPWVTREMQVRDLLIHNSGLGEGAGDLMLWPEPNRFTRAEILAGLQYLKPAHSFRSRYAYDNVLYIAAGEVAAAAAGVPYGQLLRRELFEPLGMSRCQVGEWRLDAVGNVAQPHMREGDHNVVIRADGPIVPLSPSAAAGGIRCSLNDMLTWALAWLAPDPLKPWLSTARRDELWTPHMPLPISPRQREWDQGHFHAYGYGWRLADVDGIRKVSHTGTLAGMYSVLTLLPENDAGFVVLINGDGDEARTVLNQALVKRYTAPVEARTVDYYAGKIAAEQVDAKPAPPATTPVVAGAPMRQVATPAAMAPWLGVYRDPWFGEITLCERQGRVQFGAAKSPRMTGDVMRVGQSWLVDWHDPSVDAEPWLDFTAAGANTPATLTLAKVDPDADFSYDFADLHFTRVRNCH